MGAPTRIWKYTLQPEQSTITMPRGSRAVHAAAQNDTVCLWALVDPAASPIERHVAVVGTGYDVPVDALNGEYVGAAHITRFGLVLHVFIGAEVE